MNPGKLKQVKRDRRRKRIRAKIIGSASCPRLSVFRSNRGMYVQLIDDGKGRTLVSASTRQSESKDKKTDQSFQLGKLLAKKAVAKQISQVVFDRGGYKYHGRLKSLAEGARQGGLKF